ncbi:hypothetical protein PMIN03_008979 [Paraphaeosphaeria minitans]
MHHFIIFIVCVQAITHSPSKAGFTEGALGWEQQPRILRETTPTLHLGHNIWRSTFCLWHASKKERKNLHTYPHFLATYRWIRYLHIGSGSWPGLGVLALRRAWRLINLATLSSHCYGRDMGTYAAAVHFVGNM